MLVCYLMKALHIDSLETVVCTVKCLDLHMFSLSLDMVVEFLRRFPCLEKLCIEVCCSFSSSVVHLVWMPFHLLILF